MAAPCTMWWSMMISNSARINAKNIIYNKLFRGVNRCRVVTTCQSRLCSNNSTNNEDSLSRFEKLLRERRRQARKSVLIHIYSKFVVLKLYNYCQKYGKIAKAFLYSLDSDKDFILMEFEDESSVENLLSETKHFNQHNIIPVHSKCLWYHETHQGKDLILPAELETSTITPEVEVVRSLQNASSVSDQMIQLHQHLKLTDIGQLLRFFVCHQLEIAFSGLFTNCAILPFGSSVNGFGKFNCDLDMVLSLRDETMMENDLSELSSRLFFHTKRSLSNGRVQSQRHLETLSDMISSFFPGCSNVQRILQARVPIIKFHHDLVNTECDLSMCNLTGVYMSELLYLYGDLDSRLPQLVFTVLKWARQVGLTHDSPGKWITNFSLILMTVFFLQTRPKPVLPSLGQLQKMAGPADKRITEGIDCSFLRDVNQFPKMKNDEPLDELLMGFFQYYATFEFKHFGLSLIAGQKISKPDYSSLYIENPLEVSLNVSKNVPADEVERICEKMRNALWTLEVSQLKADNGWGLLALLNVDVKLSSVQLKRLPMSAFFDKTTAKSQIPDIDDQRTSEAKRKLRLQENYAKKIEKVSSSYDLVSKLELSRILGGAGGKSVKTRKQEVRSRSKAKNKNPRQQKLQPSPWSF